MVLANLVVEELPAASEDMAHARNAMFQSDLDIVPRLACWSILKLSNKRLLARFM